MTKKYSHKKSLTRFNIVTAIVVVTLHGGVAGALVTMMPKQLAQQPDDILPVEIELISSPVASKPEPEAEPELKMESEPDSAAKIVTEKEVEQPPKPKAKPVIEPKPKPNKPPMAKPEPEPEPKPEPKPERKNEPKPEPIKASKPEVNSVAVDNSDREIKQQAAREQAAREQAAREQAAREQAAREQAAREQAAREQAAREQAAREQAAASNTPVAVSASEASWRRAPNIGLSKRTRDKVLPGDAYTVLLKMTVDKQGNIQNVSVVSSSGNALVDKDAIKAVNRAKFNPFKRGGAAVVGIVELPIHVNVN